jgi:MFS family permease
VSFSDFKKSLGAYFSDRRLTATALADLSTYFSYGAMETYLPLYLQLRGFSASQIGMIFAVQIFTIAATKPILGKAADRVDKRLQTVIGLMVLAAAMAAVPFASGIVGFMTISVAAGLAISTSTIATTTYTAEIAKQKELGASLGALSAIMDIGQTSGPLLTGIVIVYLGYAMGFALSSALAVAIAAYFLYVSYWKAK